MGQDDSESIRRLPLVYALTDDAPEESTEIMPNARTMSRRFRETVRQDLQDLLNTRERCISWRKELAQLSKSVFDYGVADVTGSNLASADQRQAFLDELGQTIRRNDPRFQSLSIHSLDNSDPYDRTLRFRIDARIAVDTGQDTAVFDFQLEPVSRHFE